MKTAAVCAIVIAGVSLRLRDQPGFLEPVYIKTPISLMEHGDLYHLREEYTGKTFLRGDLTLADITHVTPAGHDPVPTSLGRGFFAWPFLVAGRALAPWIDRYFGPEGVWPLLGDRLAGSPINWYVWQNLSGLIPFILALILLWRIIQKRVGARSATIALAACYFGTHLFLSLRRQAGASEALSLFFWAAILYLCLEIWDSNRLPLHRAVLLGFCCGVGIFIRVVSVIWILPPLACWMWLLVGRRERALRLLLAGGLFLLMVAAGAAPQLLITRCWWGTYFSNPYGQFILAEPLRDLVPVWLSNLKFFAVTPVAWLGLGGLALRFHRRTPLSLAGLAMFAFIILYMGFGHVCFIETQSVSFRHLLPMVPFYLFGLMELVGTENRRRRRWIYAAIIGITVVAYLQIMAFANPALSARSTGFNYIHELARSGLAGLVPVPVSRAGPILGLLLLIPSLVICGGAALWARWPERRRRLIGIGSAVVIPVLVTVFLLAATGIICKNSRRAVERAEERGFYRNRWRTMERALSYFSWEAHFRMSSYLEVGNFTAAERWFNLIMNIDPRGKGELGLAPVIISAYRAENGIPGHLYEKFCATWRSPGLVERVDGAEWENPEALTDGRLDTAARVKKFTGTTDSLVIRLRRAGEPLSDVIVVFDGVPKEEIAVEVSTDGNTWAKPFRVERWADTLWIWDLHQRPWTLIRLSGFSAPSETSIREIFAIFSLRHAR